MENADVEAELIADLVGDYLFTDSDFVSRLLEKNPSLFKKIFNEIKYLCKVATAGSKEAKQLEKVKRVFEKVYREAEAKINTTDEGGVRYSIASDSKGSYVKVDVNQNIFDGKNTREMQDIARKLIKDNFKGKVLPVGADGKAYINKRSADEYAYPANRRMNDTIKESKMRASTELDNLLAVSEFVENQPDDGSHPQATGGWDVYTTRFEVANTMFSGEVKIMVTDRGYVFYDITQIKRLPVNGGQTEHNSVAASGNLSNNIISKSTENVKQNGNLSLSAENTVPKEYGNYNVYGDDVRYQPDDIAPVREDLHAAKPETVTEDIAPVRSYIATHKQFDRISSSILQLSEKRCIMPFVTKKERMKNMTYQQQTALTVVIIVVLIFLLLYFGLGLVFFFMALGNKKRKDPTVPCKGSLFEKNADNPNLIAGYKWYDKTYHQEVIIKNRKGENLHGAEFRNPSNSNVWAIMIHGWTNVHRELSSYAMEYYKRGFNVLMPDLRGHHNSEHKFVTMGWMDRLDIVDWVNSLVEENPKVKIILHGVSMGGATTMMTTGEKLPENVKLAVEDCGFTSVKDIFVDQCIRKYHLPPKIVMPQASLINRLINGFFFGKASAVEQVKKSKTPTLFIHGDKDSFVLPENLTPVFEACAAPKEKYIFKGAEHAVSSHWFHEEYWQVVNAFVDKYLD